VENEWLIIKDYIPIVVVIISSVFAYIIGKSSERNKKFISMSEESVTKLLSSMYLEVIEITNTKKYDIQSIKDFIQLYSKNVEIYKIYDDVLVNELFSLSIILNEEKIDNEQLSKRFNEVSRKIEYLYWERYMVNTEGFNWFAATKTINSWYVLPGSLFLTVRKISEYTSIILAMTAYLMIVESFIGKGEGLFSYETTGTLVTIFLLTLVVYFLMNVIGTFFDKNPKLKNKRNVKDYVSPHIQTS